MFKDNQIMLLAFRKIELYLILCLCTLFLSHHPPESNDRSVSAYEFATDLEPLNQEIDLLQKKIDSLQLVYETFKPKKNYLIVSTEDNEVFLLNKNKVLHKAKCSTGSYILLKAGFRQWLFKTPRGGFPVTVKLKNPVWYKPDWAYVEEGQPIPPKSSLARYQEGVLGDYAIAFGKGYLIHGTLYKRLLGLPVTHGCIRLDDEDMYILYNSLEHQSKIFIY